MLTKFKKHFFLITILVITFLLRAYNLSFPDFTPEEARLAYRGYLLSVSGQDELNRLFPVLFNSLQDYQLPVVSYLTAGGELIFGKTELGARIPFILLGTLLVFLNFQIAKFFSKDKLFWYFSAAIAAFSPGLIFLSKIPNEVIVLTFVLTLLFYLLIFNKNTFLIIAVMIFSVLTSKFSWFILLPLTFFTVVFYLKEAASKKKIIIVGISAFLVVLSFSVFLTVPQAKRSLLENNFPLFSDITIKNGIDKLRGQGLESGWPPQIDRLLFNKSAFLIVGTLHWLSNLNPAIYFGQFDSKGTMNFSYLGAFTKILLIPAFVGIFSIVRKGSSKEKLLAGFFLILTFPALFVYPNLNLELLSLILPFMALVIACGLMEIMRFSYKAVSLIFLLVILELVLNLYNFSAEYKNTSKDRAGWVKNIADEIVKTSKSSQTAVSDDIVEDIVPFISWYTAKEAQATNLRIPWPYKFRQYNFANITIIGSEGKFRSCGINENLSIFASSRDDGKIQKETSVKPVGSFKDYLGEQRVYVYSDNVCLN